MSTIDWDAIPRVRSIFLNDKAVKLPTAKVYVFSDSVLCLGDRIAEFPRSVTSWQDKIDWFTQSPEYRELDSVDGEPVVFEWTFFPGHTTLKLLQEVQSSREENHIRPEGLIQIRNQFGSRAISVQVNIVTVSHHVFHRFPFDLLIQVSATKLSLFWCFQSIFMTNDHTFEDAIHTSLSGSPAQLSSNVGSPYVSAPDLERPVSRHITMDEKSTKSTHNYRFPCTTRPHSEIASRRFPRQWPLFLLRLQVLNKLLAASQPALPHRKQVQLPPQAVPARQNLGTYLDNLMAPQPLGPLGPL